MGSRLGEGAALCNLGTAHQWLCEYPRAIDYHEQGLAIARAIGDRSGEGTALFNLALAKETLGGYAEALENAEACRKVYVEIEDPRASSVSELAKRLRARLIPGR